MVFNQNLYWPLIVGTSVGVESWQKIGSDIVGLGGDSFPVKLKMAANATTITVGAPFDGSDGKFSGKIRIYELYPTGNQYSQVGRDIFGAVGDNFGSQLDISNDGGVIATCTTNSDSRNNTDSGLVQVYRLNSSGKSYEQVGPDIVGEAAFTRLGYGMAMSGDGTTIAVSVFSRGGVRFYNFNSTSKQYVASGLVINAESGPSSFGESMVMSDDATIIAVNSFSTIGNSSSVLFGRLFIYKFNALSKQYVKIGSDIVGEQENELFGNSLAMSADGETIAVGSPLNNGISGNFSGSVRVYKLNSSANQYEQVGLEIVGENGGDQFGRAIAMSSDGTSIAVGAMFSIGGAGSVRVYKLKSSANHYVQIGEDINGDPGDLFGRSLAMSADGVTIAVSATGLYNQQSPNSGGRIRIYKFLKATSSPTKSPTKQPTGFPTKIPTKNPTISPTMVPTKIPTKPPTLVPTKRPTKRPSKTPTKNPTIPPTMVPTKIPTKPPTPVPTKRPTKLPTKIPTRFPSKLPTKAPTKLPTKQPTNSPANSPTKEPTRQVAPTKAPMTCGIFGWNLFCPISGQCGFFRRLLNLDGCV